MPSVVASSSSYVGMFGGGHVSSSRTTAGSVSETMWESHYKDPTKKYKCSRCGEPKQGHVCKMLVGMVSVGVQIEPCEAFAGREEKTIAVRSKKSHRRFQSDPFPLTTTNSSSQAVDLPDFGLPDFQPVSPQRFQLDELFASFSGDFAIDENEAPPPPPREGPFFESRDSLGRDSLGRESSFGRSPRTPYWDAFSSPAQQQQAPRPSYGSPVSARDSYRRKSLANNALAPGAPGLPFTDDDRNNTSTEQQRQTAFFPRTTPPTINQTTDETKKTHRRIHSEPFSYTSPEVKKEAFGDNPRANGLELFLPRLSDVDDDMTFE